MAKFDPFISPTPSTLAQFKERKGSNFAIWQPWLKLFYINPLLVTVNSATNVVIYASLSAQFREECKKVLLGLWKLCRESGTDIKHFNPREATLKTTNV